MLMLALLEEVLFHDILKTNAHNDNTFKKRFLNPNITVQNVHRNFC